jgi:hypothetical protein
MLAVVVAMSAAAAVAACAERADGVDSTAEGVIAAGSLEEYSVLRFLNGPDATVDVLDVDAALDARAARNIVGHVRGADRVLGTADDDLLDSVYELDAVPYVGATALDHLLTYVDSIGGVATMTIEGVPLTDAQAAAILEVANGATAAEIDVDAALDVRAANAIVAARPIGGMGALAAVAYVGRVAIEKLRDYATLWTPPPAPPAATCDGTATLAPRASADAADFTRLLEIATTSDWPYAEVIALQATECTDVAGDPTAADAVAAALRAAPEIHWGYEDPVPITAGAWSTGAGSYADAIDTALAVIDERTADGRFDPAASAEAADLYARRTALADALKAAVLADPGAFRAVPLHLEASECSQNAHVLFDTRDGSVLIAHVFAGC